MERKNKSPITRIEQETTDSRVTIDYKRRRLAICYVFEHELKTIGSANSKTSLDIGFFSASFGGRSDFLTLDCSRDIHLRLSQSNLSTLDASLITNQSAELA